MADHYNGIVVVLEEDLREDDVEPIIAAISQIRGVASVTGNVRNFDTHIAKETAYFKLRNQVMCVLFPLKADE